MHFTDWQVPRPKNEPLPHQTKCWLWSNVTLVNYASCLQASNKLMKWSITILMWRLQSTHEEGSSLAFQWSILIDQRRGPVRCTLWPCHGVFKQQAPPFSPLDQQSVLGNWITLCSDEFSFSKKVLSDICRSCASFFCKSASCLKFRNSI